jgi:hypothetical protein
VRALRKTAEAPAPVVLVRIAEVLAELSGTEPARWVAEAEELAAGMRGQVTRDWRGHAALSPVDAERLFLRLKRDRAQATPKQGERLAALEAQRGRFMPNGRGGW